MTGLLDPKTVRRAVLGAPFRLPTIAQRLAAGRPIRLDGLELDPQMQIVSKFLSATHVPPSTQPLRKVRDQYHAMATSVDRADPPMARTVEMSIPGAAGLLPITIHVPFGVSRSAPAVVYFHGGGFVVGSRKTVEGLCHRIADGAKAIVVNVDYRLAPEHPFPAAIDDALAAYRWTIEHGHAHGIDTRKVAVAGDSAGGTMAAVTSILARDAGIHVPAAQWLLYPLTQSGADTPSRRIFARGFLLDHGTIDWFHANYLPNNEVHDFRASPLKTPSLEGLPPAFVATAGFDPLRDEGEAYAQRLAEASVRTVGRRYPGLIHGFANMRFSTAACEAVEEGIYWLKTELG